MINTTFSEGQTEKLGEKAASGLKAGDCLALYGELGSGKTALVRGICRGLKCTVDVHSPTFNIVNFYPGIIEVAHVDLYRIDKDIEDVGWDDLLGSDRLLIIEWAEKAKEFLPEKRIDIYLDIIDPGTREIRFEYNDDSGN